MNVKEKTRNARGITLIALVVTIIVLIILAGVSISLVLGDNGIVTKSKEAKENYQVAANEEQQSLANLEVELGALGGNSTTPPTVEYAPYDNPYMPTGFEYTGEGTWNSGYVIRETATGNEFVWVPCVLDQSKVKPEDTVVTFGKTTTEKYNEFSLGLLPEDTSVETEDSSVSEIEKSVETYGGFYIARYEAGIEGTEENYDITTNTGKTATDGSVKPLSQAGKGVWNYISRADAITVAEAMIDKESTGAKSALISGAAWDTTLQWMVNASENAANEPNTGYDVDSTGNGWYSDVSADETGTKTRHTTGYYAVNNIYDMAGNVWEYTTENCTVDGTSYVVGRGGSCNFSGSGDPAAYRNDNNDGAYYDFGLRVVLYK